MSYSFIVSWLRLRAKKKLRSAMDTNSTQTSQTVNNLLYADLSPFRNFGNYRLQVQWTWACRGDNLSGEYFAMEIWWNHLTNPLNFILKGNHLEFSLLSHTNNRIASVYSPDHHYPKRIITSAGSSFQWKAQMCACLTSAGENCPDCSMILFSSAINQQWKYLW